MILVVRMTWVINNLKSLEYIKQIRLNMKHVNESQTQVYINNRIEPQYRNNNLHVLTDQFFKSGKSNEQVLAILCGMGVPQPWALKAIEEYNMANTMGSACESHEDNQKNDIKMQFTLTELYGKVTDTLTKLQEMKAGDTGRISYTSENAMRVLEETLKMFPAFLKNADLDTVTEDLENSAAPSLKFNIAKTLYNQSTLYSWLNPIQEMISYLDSFYAHGKLAFKVNEAYEFAKRKGGALYERLGNDLYGVLKESSENMKNKFLAVSGKHPWSPECKSILNDLAQEENVVKEQKGGKIVKIFSPVLTEGTTHTFHLHGKDYTYDGKAIKETVVNDIRYHSIIEGLKLCSYNNGMLSIYGQKETSLDIHLDEGTITLGEIDLSKASVIEIKEALLGTNFFGYREHYKIDTVCRLVESYEMIAELDEFVSINSLMYPALFLTLLSVEEGVYVHKINGGMNLNEMKHYSSASKACKDVMEFINYDVSSYLVEQLEKEGNITILNTENRRKIQEMIAFLETKKEEINAAISTVGATPELKEALDLIASELSTKEKQLQETFISEKKSKSYYLNKGYVEGTLSKDTKGLKKGSEVMVNAEEYASSGDSDLIDVVEPKSDKSYYLPKEELGVKL